VCRCMKSTVACSAVLRLLHGHVSAVLVVGITPTALLWHSPTMRDRQAARAAGLSHAGLSLQLSSPP
jgi:hypothetical protein